MLSLILTLGFFWQLSWAIAPWPWLDSRLSFVFLASITAAIGAPVIWTGLSREYGALRGGAINLAVSNTVMAVTAFWVYASEGSSGALMLGVAALLLLIVTAGIYLLVRQYPIQDPRPLPRLVQVSFTIFVAVLIIIGGALVLGQQVFPWSLSRASAAIFGGLFLGAAGNFGYSLLRPSWHNARGQLWSFLAYDLVLIVPFLLHFDKVTPEHLLSLVIYVAVLVYSGAVAAYFLFINPATRSARAREVAT